MLSTDSSRRPFGAWLVLMMLWIVGITFSIGYVMAMGYVLFR